MVGRPWMSSFDFDDFNAQHRREVMSSVLDGLYDFIGDRVEGSIGLYAAARTASYNVVWRSWILFPGDARPVRCM